MRITYNKTLGRGEKIDYMIIRLNFLTNARGGK